jgi:hypothetical protein
MRFFSVLKLRINLIRGNRRCGRPFSQILGFGIGSQNGFNLLSIILHNASIRLAKSIVIFQLRSELKENKRIKMAEDAVISELFSACFRWYQGRKQGI